MMKSSRKVPVFATITLAFSLVILISLGTWQLQRLAWKQGLIADLTTAYDTAGAAKDLVRADVADLQFYYGRVAGQALWGQAFLMGPRVQDKKIGNSFMVPVRLNGGDHIIVNMGWTDRELVDLLPVVPDKEVQITGLLRRPYWAWMTPDNQPDQDIWYRPDLQDIATAKQLADVWPFLLYADHVTGAVIEGLPNNARWSPKNNHAQYAAFWFSMALILTVIYWLRFFAKGARDE